MNNDEENRSLNKGWEFPVRSSGHPPVRSSNGRDLSIPIRKSIERISSNILLLDRLSKKIQVWDSKLNSERMIKENNETVIKTLKKEVKNEIKPALTHETIYVNFKTRSIVARVGKLSDEFLSIVDSKERPIA